MSAISGPDDYAELDPARDPSTPLYANTTGPEVVALQNALAGVTFPIQPSGTPPTGVFDDATLSSLLKFQESRGVPDNERGFVSVYTMEQFDLMLGIIACPSYGIERITDSQVTTEISNGASAVLDSYWNFPIGTEIPFFADDKTYVGRIELHYHPYDGTVTPKGYHHGVSVFAFSSDELLSGSEFLEFTATMSLEQRESHILLELARGNIPETIMDKVNVTVVSNNTISVTNVTFAVNRDYLSIGQDDDFVRIPCAAYTAQMLADLYSSSMPTTVMVDEIWKAATNKIEPQTISPSDEMCGNAYIEKENEMINAQLEGSFYVDSVKKRPYNQLQRSSLFVGGDKKDTVLTNQYASHQNSVAEYGWHQLNGEPIQPLYLGHSSDWADYSMGIRLVDSRVVVDNSRVMTLSEFLSDPSLAPLLSNEGVVVPPRVPINPRPACACWTPPIIPR